MHSLKVALPRCLCAPLRHASRVTRIDICCRMSAPGRSASARTSMPRGRGRSGRGGGGRTGRPKVIEPVVATNPLPEDAKVAIIGGGLSGLICAQECLKNGLVPTVFDTGAIQRPGCPATGTQHTASRFEDLKKNHTQNLFFWPLYVLKSRPLVAPFCSSAFAFVPPHRLRLMWMNSTAAADLIYYLVTY